MFLDSARDDVEAPRPKPDRFLPLERPAPLLPTWMQK